MAKSFQGPSAQVLAAVKLDTDHRPALDAAVELCRRTGMSLRLVGVIEIGEHVGIRHLPFDMYDLSAIERSLGENGQQLVAAELRALAAKLDTGGPISTTTVVGVPAQAIISEAVVSGARLIVCGAAKVSHRFVPKGISTSLTLMADAPVPVMVVKDDCKLDLSRAQLKILVADDLSESGERPVLVAFDLATAIGKTDVHHVHVNSLNLETFARAARQTAAVHGAGVFKDVAPTEVWDMVQRDLHDRIRQRAPGRAAFLEAAGGHYWPEIRNGSVEAELERAIETERPDLLVFGRHRTLHRRPFSIGKVPFHFMLSQSRPLIVTPE